MISAINVVRIVHRKCDIFNKMNIKTKHISSSQTVMASLRGQGGQCRGQYLYLILTNVQIIQICPPGAGAIRLNVSHLALIHPSSSRKCPIIYISFRRELAFALFRIFQAHFSITEKNEINKKHLPQTIVMGLFC